MRQHQMSITEVRKRLAWVLSQGLPRYAYVALTRRGRPVGVLLNPEAFHNLLRQAESRKTGRPQKPLRHSIHVVGDFERVLRRIGREASASVVTTAHGL